MKFKKDLIEIFKIILILPLLPLILGCRGWFGFFGLVLIPIGLNMLLGPEEDRIAGNFGYLILFISLSLLFVEGVKDWRSIIENKGKKKEPIKF